MRCSTFRLFGQIAGIAALLSGCETTTGPEQVPGIFTLRTVNGQPLPGAGIYSPISGSITLARDGSAKRRTVYRIDQSNTTQEFIALGTYQLQDVSLRLSLRELSGQSQYVWTPLATLAGGTLTLRYPDAADGPEIVEVYVRR